MPRRADVLVAVVVAFTSFAIVYAHDEQTRAKTSLRRGVERDVERLRRREER